MTGLPIQATVVGGPERVGSELRWRVRMPDGQFAVVGQLLPELARDEALRRRYRADVERLAGVHVPGLARVLDHGGGTGDGTAPWRVRADPPGEPLSAWLERRAPAPPDEVAALGAKLGQILHVIHEHGLVVRGLDPRRICIGPDGMPTITDIGLARVDILSTRSAASLILEGSAYASPEQLLRTTVDQRSDVYALGAILWHAVTGTLPFGDTPALLRDHATLPDPRSLRPDLPPTMAELLRRCLSAEPDDRPAGVATVAAVLRGERGLSDEIAATTCQSCGAGLYVGQRICISCGHEAVQFLHSDGPEAVSVELRKVTEDASMMAALRSTLESVSAGPVPALNFIIGDQRMYSKKEQGERLRLPLILFEGVEPASAERLVQRLQEQGIKARTRSARTGAAGPIAAWTFGLGSLVAGVATLVAMGAGAPLSVALPIILSVLTVVGLIVTVAVSSTLRKKLEQPGLLRLRAAPAALPASDPLVARLAALVTDGTSPDVKARVGALALQIQRLVDHRASLSPESRAEAGLAEDLLEPLLARLESEVRRVNGIDASLAELDEGALVRALSAAEARSEPTGPILEDLDRLRALEDERARALHRLLEAGSLLERAIELGLSVKDDAAAHLRQVQLALSALGPAD